MKNKLLKILSFLSCFTSSFFIVQCQDVSNSAILTSPNTQVIKFTCNAAGILYVDKLARGNIAPNQIIRANLAIGSHSISVTSSQNNLCTFNSILTVDETGSERLYPMDLLSEIQKLKEVIENTFTDSRDGQIYPYKQIGTQVWMTKNLNYNATGSWCYENSSDNCDVYGRLYDWQTALSVAPQGWHIPSDQEWEILIKNLGGEKIAGEKLKSKKFGPLFKNPANDSSGFTALAGGNRYNFGKFDKILEIGFWWSSTEKNTTSVWVRMLYSYWKIADRLPQGKANFFSIRCIKD